jgi:hypothetical protein
VYPRRNRANAAVRVRGYRDSRRIRSFIAGRPDVARTKPRSSSSPLSGSAAFRWQETVIGDTRAKLSSVITPMAEPLCRLVNRRGVGLDIDTPRRIYAPRWKWQWGLMGLLTKGWKKSIEARFFRSPTNNCSTSRFLSRVSPAIRTTGSRDRQTDTQSWLLADGFLRFLAFVIIRSLLQLMVPDSQSRV